MKKLILLSAVAVAHGAYGQDLKDWRGELIPRSMSERAVQYHLLSVENEGDFVKTLHKRVGSSGTGFSITRIDCKALRYQDLGYGDDAVQNIKMYDDVRWTELVDGSSKSDLVKFVCLRGGAIE